MNSNWEQSTPFYQYDTQNGHFKGRHEENVCSCTAQQWPQRALFHQNMGCSDRDWTMKKMTQMADKDRPCTPLRFLLPTPVSVFNFLSSTRMEEVEKGYCWKREKRWKRRGGKGREGRGEYKRDNKDKEALAACRGTDGLLKQSTGHRALEGVGLGQGTVRQTLG